MRTNLALCLLLLVIASLAPQSASAGPRHTLELAATFSGVAGSFDLAGDFVFRDEPSWCAFWGEAFVFPPADCPAVDFRHQVVIATVGGAGGCDGFHIESVERDGSRRAVETLVQHTFLLPGSLCGCTADFRVQAHAVVVARPIGNVEFVHESVGFECPLIQAP